MVTSRTLLATASIAVAANALEVTDEINQGRASDEARGLASANVETASDADAAGAVSGGHGAAEEPGTVAKSRNVAAAESMGVQRHDHRATQTRVSFSGAGPEDRQKEAAGDAAEGQGDSGVGFAGIGAERGEEGPGSRGPGARARRCDSAETRADSIAKNSAAAGSRNAGACPAGCGLRGPSQRYSSRAAGDAGESLGADDGPVL